MPDALERPPVLYLQDRDPTYTIHARPLDWQRAGLQQTATGYGCKLTSSMIARLTDGRTRRIYITCYSNSGSAWIILDKQRYYLESCANFRLRDTHPAQEHSPC